MWNFQTRLLQLPNHLPDFFLTTLLLALGDCSRILANFYLQDYDAYMKVECDGQAASYLRYADDQIMMANDKEILYNIL